MNIGTVLDLALRCAWRRHAPNFILFSRISGHIDPVQFKIKTSNEANLWIMLLFRNLIIRDWRPFDANERQRLSAVRTTEIETPGIGSNFRPSEPEVISLGNIGHTPLHGNDLQSTAKCHFRHAVIALLYATFWSCGISCWIWESLRTERRAPTDIPPNYQVIRSLDRRNWDDIDNPMSASLMLCGDASRRLCSRMLSCRFDCLGKTPANRNYTNSSTESAMGCSRRFYPGLSTGRAVEFRPGALD